MRTQHRGGVFGMELCTDIPAQCGNLNDFDQVCLWVDADTVHPIFLQFILKYIIKFISMAVCSP